MARPKRLFIPRLKTFSCALRGIVVLLRTQPNARFHALASVFVVIFGLLCHLPTQSWLWLAVAIALVWIAEGLNTAVELLADTVHPQQHPGIRDAKDVAAGAVLIAALVASVIGAVIFSPYCLSWLSSR